MSTKPVEGSSSNNGFSNSPTASEDIIPDSSPLSSINSSSSSNSDQSTKRAARNSGEIILQKGEEADIELKSTRIIDGEEEEIASTRASKSRAKKDTNSSSTKPEKPVLPEDEEDDDEPIDEEDNDVEDEPSEITRCICGHQDLQLSNVQNKEKVDTSLFIQCDMCEVWQHGFCVGLLTNEDVPDVYFCEKCRPEYHVIVVRPNGRTSKYSPQDPSEEDLEAPEDAISRNKDSNLVKGENDNADADMANEEEDSSSSRSRSSKRKRGNKQEAVTASSPSSRRQSAQNSPRSPSVSATTGTTTVNNPDTATPSSAAAAAAAAAHSRHTRTRPTLNSQVYEENLRRALEESVHDTKTGEEDENANADNAEITTNLRRTPSSRIRSNEQKGGSSSSEEQSGSRPSSRRNQNKPSSRSKTSQYSSSKAGLQDGQGSETGAYTGRKRSLDAAGIDDELSDSAVKSRNKRPSGSSNTGTTASNGKTATLGAEEELSSTNAPPAATPSSKRKRPRSRGNNRGDSPQTGSNSHRNQFSNNNKFDCPSKPRIPPSRTSMPEMQKRVAALLEFISRTRQDLEIEHEHRHRLLQYRKTRFKEIYGGLDEGDISMELLRMQATDGDNGKSSSSSRGNGSSRSSKSKKSGSSSSQKDSKEAGSKSELNASNGANTVLAASTLLENYNELLDESKFNVMFESYQPSVSLMESLTSKLIEWEERFGRYREN